ncbi:hypothetical protein [Bordetella genomosp. 10]|uniref:hypothetical protein n=1 Tax=Bordetella genomosp. 10 TaxID=1416804 RepID=UPI00359C6285
MDVVVHNAGHLVIGYVEAFTAADIAHLFDVNVLGAQRVNRAVPSHVRARRHGTLLYVGRRSNRAHRAPHPPGHDPHALRPTPDHQQG